MQRDVSEYIAAIPPEHRDLFDRVHRLILEVCPQVEIGFAYKMPTYRLGRRRLNVAVWQHGVSIYGWKATGDGGLTRRHPVVQANRGTIKLTAESAAVISDDEIRALARAALSP